MNHFRFRNHYQRKLPHYQPPGATLFVTFRLAGSLPAHIIQKLQEEFDRAKDSLIEIEDPAERAQQIYDQQRRYFGKWDKALDTSKKGPFYLSDPRIAALVSESLHYRDGRVFTLDAFCIMPNHVHVVFTPLPKKDDEYHSLASIMHSLKRFAALEANKVLNRKGQFWQHESYDHVVRDEVELNRIIHYVVHNPVKASLVENWKGWPGHTAALMCRTRLQSCPTRRLKDD